MSSKIERDFVCLDGKYIPLVKVFLEPCEADDSAAWEERNLLADRIEQMVAAPAADHCEDALGKVGPVVERHPNQCDGCRAGKPLVHGNLHMMVDASGYQDIMACTAHLYTAPPELAELQATIARLTAENERLARRDQMLAEVGCEYCGGSGHVSRIDGEYLGVCDQCPSYELNCTKHERDQLKADIERLKGGQGEPVAWQLDVEGYKTVTLDNYQRALSEKEHFHGRGRTAVIRNLYTSQTAPVSLLLPTIMSTEDGPHYSDNRASELGYLAGYNACLDKVKEMNQ